MDTPLYSYDVIFENVLDQLSEADLSGLDAVRAFARGTVAPRATFAKTRDAQFLARYIARKLGVRPRVESARGLGVASALEAAADGGLLVIVDAEALAGHVSLALACRLIFFSDAEGVPIALTDAGRLRILEIAGVPDDGTGRGAASIADVFEAIGEWTLSGRGRAWKAFACGAHEGEPSKLVNDAASESDKDDTSEVFKDDTSEVFKDDTSEVFND